MIAKQELLRLRGRVAARRGRDREGLRARLAARRDRERARACGHLDLQGRHLPAQVLLRDLPLLRGPRLHRARRRPGGARRARRDLQSGSPPGSHESQGWSSIDRAGHVHRRQNLRGQPTTQARIAYRGPNAPRATLPKLKLDLTSDEVLVERPVRRGIVHSYSDQPLPGDGVLCYSPTELLAEKTRALAERCRPRDLYDVVHMHRHPDLIGQARASTSGPRRQVRARRRRGPRRGLDPRLAQYRGDRARVGEHARPPAAATTPSV